MTDNPYGVLPERAFWRKAVAERSPFDVADLWVSKFTLAASDPVATYGSCFAQHIGAALQAQGHSWLITERAPARCPPMVARQYNYGIFSSRTANIYTTTLLRQWVSWASGAETPAEVWREGERYIDPFRPAIEPEGFTSVEELRISRGFTVAAFRKSIEQAKVFVFTLGLTEGWINSDDGYEYPMCPGTVGGKYDSSRHRFVNQSYDQVRQGLLAALDAMRRINPSLRVILTVSPVPLTATASGAHVLVATTYSKSVLRAVAGQLASECDWIDYFPSYEIINSAPFGGIFFEPNKRSVNPAGVAFVMKAFFAGVGSKPPEPTANVDASKARAARREAKAGSDNACEEALLDAFGPKS
jgi:hypothetical protein